MPSDMVAMTEGVVADTSGVTATAAAKELLQWGVWVPPPWSGKELRYPHLDQVNNVFCDGHVERFKRADFLKSSDDFWRRWNRDHEPHPETRK